MCAGKDARIGGSRDQPGRTRVAGRSLGAGLRPALTRLFLFGGVAGLLSACAASGPTWAPGGAAGLQPATPPDPPTRLDWLAHVAAETPLDVMLASPRDDARRSRADFYPHMAAKPRSAGDGLAHGPGAVAGIDTMHLFLRATAVLFIGCILLLPYGCAAGSKWLYAHARDPPPSRDGQGRPTKRCLAAARRAALRPNRDCHIRSERFTAARRAALPHDTQTNSQVSAGVVALCL